MVIVREQQVREGDQYRYSILFNHEEVFTMVNTKPQVFKNVQTFVGDRFYYASDAIVQNIKFENIES